MVVEGLKYRVFKEVLKYEDHSKINIFALLQNVAVVSHCMYLVWMLRALSVLLQISG